VERPDPVRSDNVAVRDDLGRPTDSRLGQQQERTAVEESRIRDDRRGLQDDRRGFRDDRREFRDDRRTEFRSDDRRRFLTDDRRLSLRERPRANGEQFDDNEVTAPPVQPSLQCDHICDYLIFEVYQLMGGRVCGC